VTQLDGGDAVHSQCVSYPDSVERNRFCSSSVFFAFEISGCMSWTSYNLLEQGRQLAERYLCGLESIRLRHPAWLLGKRCVRTMQINIFAGFLICAAVTPKLEPLVEQSFSRKSFKA